MWDTSGSQRCKELRVEMQKRRGGKKNPERKGTHLAKISHKIVPSRDAKLADPKWLLWTSAFMFANDVRWFAGLNESSNT